jgi:ABC-type proline/glycine betaine transport system permease subunit
MRLAAVIGAGNFGRTHIETIRGEPERELVAQGLMQIKLALLRVE